MSVSAAQEYLSIGGNRHSAASAWCPTTGTLAYGVDRNIALWRPLTSTHRGIYQILQGHNDNVTAIASSNYPQLNTLISGAANGDVIVWSKGENDSSDYSLRTSKAHDGAVNIVATSENVKHFVTGGADGVVKVWKTTDASIELVTTIKPKPRLIPLSIAIGLFPDVSSDEGLFVAIAGTSNVIQMYTVSTDVENPHSTLECILTGHEGWIRSLALKRSGKTEYLLASTSADKYTRLWKIQSSDRFPQPMGTTATDVATFQQTLTAKAKIVSFQSNSLSITFEALLLGHEDWVYSADWHNGDEVKLLTTSADGTLAIWEPDPTSGIWVSETRLGEISGQKGATTATGSTGGFWTGKWISDDMTTAVVSLGRTGSWRIWHYDTDAMFWDLKHGVTGHVGPVNSLCWSPSGEYLLTTSTDQTTRLHAEWRREKNKTWHEFSRCQIHGYDCNVVSSISPHQFVSGADEKLLRVFNEPKDLADTLHRLCDIEPPQDATLPETAAIPVLGLSNKEMGEPDDIIEAGPRKGDEEYAAASALAEISIRGINEPPTEDLLSRHTLWPEHEKLYGHGYEISESAYGHGLLATACKASSIDHATIRLYDPQNEWRQIEPPLTAHSLTVTRLAWSKSTDCRYLLSVGRDRQWTVFEQEGNGNRAQIKLYQAMPRAHTRMILDAAWSPFGDKYPFFATAGRDKTVKLWGHTAAYPEPNSGDAAELGNTFRLCTTLTRPSAVTAVDFTCRSGEGWAILAVGEDDGTLSIHFFDIDTLKLDKSFELRKDLGPSKTVNRLSWRPDHDKWEAKDETWGESHLAVAGADCSVRILKINIMSLSKSVGLDKDEAR